jgi:hypothetical protein
METMTLSTIAATMIFLWGTWRCMDAIAARYGWFGMDNLRVVRSALNDAVAFASLWLTLWISA